MKEFSNLDWYPKTKRGTIFLQKEATFVEKMESLFDIFCEDKTERRHLENAYRLRMCKKDYALH